MLRYLRYLRSSINTLLGEWDVASSTLKHGMHVAIAAQTDSADHQPVLTKLQTCLTWRRDGRRYYYGTEHYERVVVVEEGAYVEGGKGGKVDRGRWGLDGGGATRREMAWACLIWGKLSSIAGMCLWSINGADVFSFVSLISTYMSFLSKI